MSLDIDQLQKLGQELGRKIDEKFGHDNELVIIDRVNPGHEIYPPNHPFFAFTEAENILSNGWVCVYLQPDEVNAFASIIDNTPFVGIFSGCVARIADMLKLPIINAKLDTPITISDYPNKASFMLDKDGKLDVKIDWTGLEATDCAEVELRLKLALEYILFHEIGHIKKGHINNDSVSNYNLLFENLPINEGWELAADVFAIEHLCNKIDDIAKTIADTFGINSESSYHFALLQILTAYTTVIMNLTPQNKIVSMTIGARITMNHIFLENLLVNNQKLITSITNTKNIVEDMQKVGIISRETYDELFENNKITESGFSRYTYDYILYVCGHICRAYGCEDRSLIFQASEFSDFIQELKEQLFNG